MPLILKHLILLFSFSFLLLGKSSTVLAEEKGSLPPPQSWTAFQEADYGATLYYPSNWFSKAEKKGEFFTFASLHDKAILTFRTYLDPLRTGAEETAKKLKASLGGHRLISLKQDTMWYEAELNGDEYVLPGEEAKPVLKTFIRTVYSCKERIVSQISLTYPTVSAEHYEPIIKKMVQRFQQGVGAKTPVRDCS